MVALLISGDADVWRSFIEDFGRLVRWRVADVARSFGFSSDSSSIDDSTSHVIASLVANEFAVLRTYRGHSSLATYLAVVATRVATRDFARLRARLRKQSQSSSANTELVALHDPIVELLRTEQRQQILSALNELPVKQREVVRLFHLEGLSYLDISQTLQIPIGSVGVTLKRAEEKLRYFLESSNES